jgi:hypothetical protein
MPLSHQLAITSMKYPLLLQQSSIFFIFSIAASSIITTIMT